MNVLEKILEEIEDHAIEFESFGMCDDYVSVGWAKDIIRSHMGDVPKCRECSRRKFYMQVLFGKLNAAVSIRLKRVFQST